MAPQETSDASKEQMAAFAARLDGLGSAQLDELQTQVDALEELSVSDKAPNLIA